MDAPNQETFKDHKKDQKDAPQHISVRTRKHRDYAALLPIFGVLLLATPFISTVNGSETATILDMAIYIFCIWGALIAASYWFSKIALSAARDDQR